MCIYHMSVTKTGTIILALKVILLDQLHGINIDCLEKLNVVVENINSTYITIVGDFNANLSRSSVFGDILVKFCADNNLTSLTRIIIIIIIIQLYFRPQWVHRKDNTNIQG